MAEGGGKGESEEETHGGWRTKGERRLYRCFSTTRKIIRLLKREAEAYVQRTEILAFPAVQIHTVIDAQWTEGQAIAEADTGCVAKVTEGRQPFALFDAQ